MKPSHVRVRMPVNSNPFVHRVYSLINAQQRSIAEVARTSGVNECTIMDWRRKASPGVTNLEAVLNALGYQLAIVPLEPTRPQ